MLPNAKGFPTLWSLEAAYVWILLRKRWSGPIVLKGYEGRILIFMLYHFSLNFINGSFVASSTCIERDKGKKEVGATHDFFLLLSRFDQCCFDAI